MLLRLTYTTQLFGESSSFAFCYVNNFLLHYTICIRQIPLMLPSLLATSWLSGQLSKATPDFRSVNFICFTVYFNTFLYFDLAVLASYSFATTEHYSQAISFYTALFLWRFLLPCPVLKPCYSAVLCCFGLYLLYSIYTRNVGLVQPY